MDDVVVDDFVVKRNPANRRNDVVGEQNEAEPERACQRDHLLAAH